MSAWKVSNDIQNVQMLSIYISKLVLSYHSYTLVNLCEVLEVHCHPAPLNLMMFQWSEICLELPKFRKEEMRNISNEKSCLCESVVTPFLHIRYTFDELLKLFKYIRIIQ
jgi:hypothetical protein